MNQGSKLPTFGYAVLLSVVGAIAFGIVHDLIGVQIASDYYTIYHPQLISSDSPILIAMAWGVAATWWVGLGAGVFLGLVAVVGRLPSSSFRDVRRAVVFIIVCVMISALVAGIYCLVRRPTSPDFADNEWTTLVYVTTVISYLVSTPLTLGAGVWMISRRFNAGLEDARIAARQKRNLPTT